MSKKAAPDLVLFTLMVVLLVIGLFLVFDASYARAGQVKYTHGDSFYFMKRQVLFAVIGVIGMFLTMRIRYWKLKRLAPVLLAGAIFGLVLVFVPGFGVNINGATRWISLGGIQLQPSEIAKICLIIYLASVISAKRGEIRNLQRGLVPIVIPAAIVIFLVVIEDMGTAITLALTTLIMIYMAGAKIRHLLAAAGICLVLCIIFVAVEPYRIGRLTVFLDPFKDAQGSGYQVCHSLIALGSGGPLGVGICEGREKLFYLPAEHTDFIFAVLGEEAGLIGTVLVAALFLAFAARGFIVALQTKDLFGRLMAGGISALIGGQAFLNMGVVTSSLPATGVPMPFISYGGTSLAINLFSVGILLAVSKYPKPPEDYSYEDSIDRRRDRRPRVSGNMHSRRPSSRLR
jgi:cell division protein FtsW